MAEQVDGKDGAAKFGVNAGDMNIVDGRTLERIDGQPLDLDQGVINPAQFFPVSIKDGHAYLGGILLAGFSVEDSEEVTKIRIEFWKVPQAETEES